MSPRPFFASFAVGSLLALGLAACGGDSTAGGDAPPVSLTPAGEVGYEVFRNKGCQACHGASGEGGVGPPLTGLYGTNVPLQSGVTVTADDEYIVRSIVDPNADKVAGYNIPMSTANLSDEELESLLAFIRDLGSASRIPGL